MSEKLSERLDRLAGLTVESPAPHQTGDMKFYVYDAETREAMTEAAAALRAVEGDAVDAARYRWLRDEASKVKGMSPAVIYATEHFDVSSDECGGFEYGPDLDAAIDKARGVPVDAARSAEGVES